MALLAQQISRDPTETSLSFGWQQQHIAYIDCLQAVARSYVAHLPLPELFSRPRPYGESLVATEADRKDEDSAGAGAGRKRKRRKKLGRQAEQATQTVSPRIIPTKPVKADGVRVPGPVLHDDIINESTIIRPMIIRPPI